MIQCCCLRDRRRNHPVVRPSRCHQGKHHHCPPSVPFITTITRDCLPVPLSLLAEPVMSIFALGPVWFVSAFIFHLPFCRSQGLKRFEPCEANTFCRASRDLQKLLQSEPVLSDLVSQSGSALQEHLRCLRAEAVEPAYGCGFTVQEP